ncbi:hypothetical protein BUMB_04763 [Candidatus Paraburkholderia calva]|nr:hypothetical protein BUMB_04763 [Candidatus Paraburkholderia calva]
MRYAFSRAGQLTYGQLSGPRDGSSLIESALDELMDTGACSIVMPLGNRHLSRCHGAVTIAEKHRCVGACRRTTIPRASSKSGSRPMRRRRRWGVCIAPPDGTSRVWIRHGEHATYSSDGDTLCTVVHRGRGARGDGHMILIVRAPCATRASSRRGAASGDWFIHLRNRGTVKANAVYYCARHASLCRVTQPRA